MFINRSGKGQIIYRYDPRFSMSNQLVKTTLIISKIFEFISFCFLSASSMSFFCWMTISSDVKCGAEDVEAEPDDDDGSVDEFDDDIF